MAISLGLVLVLVAACFAAWLIWLKSAHGFSANAAPTWIESKFAALSRSLALPSSGNALRDPYPATPARLEAARDLFQSQCALCHGSSGDAQTEMGQSLYPKTPDLRGFSQNKSDGALFYSIRNGIRMSGMPAWNQLSDDQVWGLVALIRTMRVQPQRP